MVTFRIFVSSPTDVNEERQIARRVIERLQSEFRGLAVLNAILWEDHAFAATASFQEQIPRPSEIADVCIFILWSRLGTPLPASFTAADGSSYTGTEYEFVDALKGNREKGIPDIFVWRKQAPRMIDLGSGQAAVEEAQMKAVKAFFDRYFRDPHGSFLAAFNEFTKLPDFELSLELALRKWIENRLGAPDRSTQPWNHSPFRGLDTFGFDDADVYCGRTQAVNEVLNSLRLQRRSRTTQSDVAAFVLILARSGVGKSSLIRAGVLPMLAHPRIIEGIDSWRYCVIRPSDHTAGVFEALAVALFRSEALGEELSRFGSTVEEFSKDLRQYPVAAMRQLRAAILQVGAGIKEVENPVIWLAVFIDQFEEVLTLERITPEERAAFVTVLSLMAHSGFVWVVATCRSDFFSRLVELPHEFNEMRRGPGQFELHPPTLSELQRMIRTPAEMAHLRFDRDPRTGRPLDEDLLDAASRDSAALPLLEFTLDELFKRRGPDGLLTYEAYRELGGMEGALGRRANSVWEGLNDDEKRAFPELMSLLVGVNPEDSAVAVRKRVALEIASNTAPRKSLVNKLIAERLCTTDSAGGIAIVGLSHEAMLDHWSQLKQWVELNRAFLKTRATFGMAARIWIDHRRASGFLLIDETALGEGRELLRTRSDVLEPHEIEFLEASLAQQRQRQRQLYSGRMLALGVLALLVVVRALDPAAVQSLRLRGFDVLEQLAPRKYQPLPVKIVAIDDKSLAQYGQWPWSRARVAELVDKIASGKPSVLGVNILFAEPDRLSPGRLAESDPEIPANLADELSRLPSHDSALADALRKVPTVLAVGVSNEAVRAGGKPAGDAQLILESGANPRPFLFTHPALVRSLPEIAAAESGQGSVDAETDRDGVTRRVPLFIVAEGRLEPNLALEMLRVASRAGNLGIVTEMNGVAGATLGEHFLPTDRHGRVYPYFTPSYTERYISAADLLNGSYDPVRLNGAQVLLGSNALGLTDQDQTPRGLMPGIEVWAQTLESMLTGDLLRRPAFLDLVEIAIVLIAGLVIVFALPYSNPRAGAAAFLGLVALLLVSELASFKFSGLLLDGVYPSLSSVFVFGLMLSVNLRAAEMGRR